MPMAVLPAAPRSLIRELWWVGHSGQVIAAAPPESPLLPTGSSTDKNFILAMLREANPVFLRLRRNDREFTISIQKVCE